MIILSEVDLAIHKKLVKLLRKHVLWGTLVVMLPALFRLFSSKCLKVFKIFSLIILVTTVNFSQSENELFWKQKWQWYLTWKIQNIV